MAVHVSGEIAYIVVALFNDDASHVPSSIPLKERPPKRDTITTSELIQYMTLPRLSAKCRTILRTTLPVNAVPDVVFILRLGLDEVVHAFVPVGDGTLYRHGMFVLIESADPKRLSIDVAEIIAINQGHMHTMRSNNTPLRRIFRPLTASELASLDEKRIIETHDFELIKNSMNDWTWLPEENLQVVGLRYQWDKRRAVVYFHSSKMVQFKKLLFKLSSILKTRVHMVPTDGSFVPVRPAHDGIGK